MLVSRTALTVRPVLVVTALIVSMMTSWEISGRPRQFMVIAENSRCSIRFHLLVPGGRRDIASSQWPWLPGTIVEQCGPDEWYVCVEVRELAVLRDGRRAPRGTASRNLYYPCCYRDGSEIQPRPARTSAVS